MHVIDWHWLLAEAADSYAPQAEIIFSAIDNAPPVNLPLSYFSKWESNDRLSLFPVLWEYDVNVLILGDD